MKTHIIFGLTVLVLIIAFMFGSSYYKGKQAEKIGFMAQENASIFIRDHSQVFGSDDAKVYLGFQEHIDHEVGMIQLPGILGHSVSLLASMGLCVNGIRGGMSIKTSH